MHVEVAKGTSTPTRHVENVVLTMKVRINLPLFPPSSHQIYVFFCPIGLSLLSTGIVGVEVTSVSWLRQLTVGIIYI